MSSFISQIWQLIKVDFKVEYRNKYEIYGLILFVIVTAYILYRATEITDVFAFNALYWVMILVISTNFALRSFTKTKEEETRYLYQLVDAKSVICSKILFNWFLIFIGGTLFLLFGLLFHGYEGFPLGKFILLLVVASLAISSTFSLPSALIMTLSSKGTLLGILSFPISIPLVLISTNIGGQLITENVWNMNALGMLISITLIMSVMSLLLFKYNWQS